MLAPKPSVEHRAGKPKDRSTPKANNDQRAQHTISELFVTSKNRPTRQEAETTPYKRLKRDHLSFPSDNAAPPPRTMQREQMYSSFPTANTKKSEIIEISDDESPPKPSATRSKPNGAIRPKNTTPQAGVKKLVVKNLRKTPRTDPDQYYNHVWDQLDAALSAIFANEKVPYSMEELYRGVEILCRQGRAPSLYGKLRDKCKQVSARMERPLMAATNTGNCVDVLRTVVETWSAWTAQLATVRSIFFYLDRSYVLHSPSLPSIEDMAITEFRLHILSNETVMSRILQGACDVVSIDRQEKLDPDSEVLLRNAIKMFHRLTVYTKHFECIFIDDSVKYFRSWAQQEVTTSSLADYVVACHKLLDRESRRCVTFGLDSATRTTIEEHLEDILIDKRQERLLDMTDVLKLLEQDAADSLRLLYTLLTRKHLEEKLKHPFEAFIVETGSGIVFDEEREGDMVIRLLEFKKKLDLIWEHSFEKHEGLGHTLREAFETFINKSKRTNMTWGTDNPKPGEMIAKYVDMILKGGAKVIPATLSSASNPIRRTVEEYQEASSDDEDTEITKQLDQVLSLFRFVHGKAVFEAFYKRDLARRLLLQRSASADAEKSMLTRLKSECGAGFTHNLEQMFKDMELAREEITSYKSMLEERQIKSSVDLNVSVLSASAWPFYPDVAIEIPRNIQNATASFEQHYKMKHSGRKLTWKHALAHCQLKAAFPRGNKEIVVSSFQAIVLLLFNEIPPNEQVAYVDIRAATNLNDAELKRTLQSLACAKYRVLSKTPKGKDVNESDTFSVNLNFSDPKYRIKINQIQAKETVEENKETHERVAADRNYETQAAIVRIMKTRKKITHAELVSEVIAATKSRGVLDPADIKKNIEKLIDKDYMERVESEGSRNVYSYLA